MSRDVQYVQLSRQVKQVSYEYWQYSNRFSLLSTSEGTHDNIQRTAKFIA